KNNNLKVQNQSPDQTLDELSKEIISFNKIFIDEIKNKLISEQINSALVGSDLIKAKKCSKELRDHFNYLSLNLNLFCKTVSSDLYALGAIVPFMCIGFHLVLEQHIKHGIIVKGLEFQSNHNLRNLCEFSDYIINADQQNFINDFKRAMIQTRYPIAARDNIEETNRSKPLKWTLFSKTLCENIISIKKNEDDSTLKASLFELGDFVFESYEQTVKCLINNIQFDSETSSRASVFMTQLKKLKNLLQLNIQENATSLLEVSIAKKQAMSQKGSEILESREYILGELEKFKQSLQFTGTFAGQPLEEAASHLLMIDSVDYLQQNYDSIEFAALHHRNSLMFQWVYEQIYTFQGMKMMLIDFREIQHHNLEAYHMLTFPEVKIPLKLNDFNLGRALHYSHEKEKAWALPLVKDLLKVRKYLKKVDASEPEWTVVKDKSQTLITPKDKNVQLKQNRRNNFGKGINLVKDLLKLVFGGNENCKSTSDGSSAK
ncbi:MAG: hypothetical protein H0U27_07515, partial [Nitrosopumilus sp.]|nr:hypothetical protein [Nitrosopumilus sp.]